MLLRKRDVPERVLGRANSTQQPLIINRSKRRRVVLRALPSGKERGEVVGTTTRAGADGPYLTGTLRFSSSNQLSTT